MAEETIENQGTEELQSTEAQAETVDWEAKYKELQKESRKWESRAKANKSAADELRFDYQSIRHCSKTERGAPGNKHCES